MRKLVMLAIFVSLLSASRARAGDLTVHVGPPSIGTGGTNPVSIPPVNPIEYEFVWVTEKDYEWTIGITPGLFYGGRSRLTSGTYVGFGGGLVIGANGSGPGMYSCIGTDLGSGWVKFNAEFKQAIGFDYSNNSLISPYAIRIGATFEL